MQKKGKQMDNQKAKHQTRKNRKQNKVKKGKTWKTWTCPFAFFLHLFCFLDLLFCCFYFTCFFFQANSKIDAK
jgi:hypothetical protein